MTWMAFAVIKRKKKIDEWALVKRPRYHSLGGIIYSPLWVSAPSARTGRLLLSRCTRIHTRPHYTRQPKSLVAPPRCLKYPNSSGVKSHICQKVVARNEMIKPCDQSLTSTTSGATFLGHFLLFNNHSAPPWYSLNTLHQQKKKKGSRSTNTSRIRAN